MSILLRSGVPSPIGDGNLLLGALPRDDYQRIRSLLSTVHIHARETLQDAGEPLTAVFFPNDGVASVTTTMPDGTLVETATVGSEGMVGVEAFLSSNPISIAQTVLQVGDATFERMTVGGFQNAVAASGALRNLLGRYTQVLMATAMQGVGCNALHTLPSRCARWLLTTHDRVHGETFRLSHEFLATMLGVHRPSVTVAARTLQAAGIITYRYGKVTVLDRQRLEEASCDCYRVIRDHFVRAGLRYPGPS